MPRFPIGFWNYTDLTSPCNDDPVACVRDWAEAGMTLTMSPNFGPEPERIARARAILDAAAEADIRVILGHNHGYWRHLIDVGEAQYRNDFKAAVKALGDHPAAFGFHVGDEPDTDNFPHACLATRIQKELAPGLQPFLNLLPWHPGCEGRVGFESWANYLDAFVEQAQPPCLCYDCYAQMNPDPQDSPWGYEMYFRNLREYLDAGRRGGIDYWTTLLSVGHFRYRCPTEDDLRWQLNTALAHGAKGILYFFFYMRQPHENYRVAPIDEHWQRTQTYDWLSRVNRTFLQWHAPAIAALTLLRVQHVGRAFGGFPLFDGSMPGSRVSRAEGSHDVPLIVSEYRHADGGEYVSVVNNSQTDCGIGTLWLRGRRPALRRVVWGGGEEPVKGGDGWKASQGADYVTVRPWLAPGQMELYRVVDEGSAG